MKPRHWFVAPSLLVLILLPPPCRAQGLFEEALERPEETPSSLELSGYIRGNLYLGKVPDQEVTEVKNGFGEAAAKVQVRTGEWGDGIAELRLSQGYDGGQVRGNYSLREAYANVYLGPFDLRFGHQIIAWGRADGFNPTDNLTPLDLRVRSPVEDDRRAANLALRINFYLTPLRAELVYVPFYAPSYFPAFDLKNPISFAAPDYPDTDFEHGILASRIHMEFAAVDFSVSYLFGYSTFPGLGLSSLEVHLTEPPVVAIQFRAYQHQVVGADFSTTVGDLFGLRGEAALRWPKKNDMVEAGEGELIFGANEHVPLPELQYILGVDREFGDLHVIAQYIGKTVLEWKQVEPTGLLDMIGGDTIDPELLRMVLEDFEAVVLMARTEIERKTRMVAGQTVQYSHAASARLGWKLLQETLSLEIFGFYNFSTEEWMLRPKIEYKITDGLAATFGAEIFAGPDETLYGTIDEIMSAGFMELKAFF